jgi:NADPH:quinone reductase-like Zn-dependent oxidoreductase
VLGIEAVGVVESAPGSEFRKGDIVASAMGGKGRQFDGGYAEFTCVPATQVQVARTELPWETLGAIPEMLQAAWGSLFNKWSFDNFAPKGAIPTAVSLTTYAGESEDFMRTALEDLVEKIAPGTLLVQVGKTFHLDEIAEAHRCMEENKAGGKIVVLT